MLSAPFCLLETPFILLGIMAFSFYLRWRVRAARPNIVATDTYFHLSRALDIRANCYAIPDKMDRMLPCDKYFYPYLYHLILSLFPDKARLRFERMSSAIFDTAGIFFSFLLAYTLALGLGQNPEQAAETALWCALLYGTAPALLRVGGGPRAYHGTARTFGEMLYLVFLACALMFEITQRWDWAAVAIGSVVLILVTSRFTNQVLLFISAGLLMFGVPSMALLVTAGYALAYPLTGGRVHTILSRHISYLSIYRKRFQKAVVGKRRKDFSSYITHARQLTGNFIANAGALLRNIRAGRIQFVQGALDFLRWVFSEDYKPHLFIVAFPHLVIAAIVLGTTGSVADGAGSEVWKVVLLVVASSIFCFGVTLFKKLYFIGEPERYLEHTVILQLFVLVIAVQEIEVYIILFIYGLLHYFFSVSHLERLSTDWKRIWEDLPVVLAQVDKADANIYCLGQLEWPTLYFTRKSHVYANINDEKCERHEDMVPLFGDYPMPTIGLDELVKRYPVDYVITSRFFQKEYENKFCSRVFMEGLLTIVAENGDFLAYEVSSG